MFCPNCGTQNNDGVAFCASCGTALNAEAQQQPEVQQQPVYQQPVQPAYQQTAVPGKGLGITSMVLGIVSLVLFCIWYVAIPCAIIGLVLGIIGKKKATEVGMKNGMANAGIICSCIALGIALLFILLAATACSAALSSVY